MIPIKIVILLPNKTNCMESRFHNLTWIALLLIILLNGPNLFGQLASPNPISFKNIGAENGLSNLSVSSFCEDDLGYIWIGTSRGLNRFDGNNFEQFFFVDGDSLSLYHDFITNIIVKGRKLYIGTNNGLNCYDIEKEKMTRIGSLIASYTALTMWGDVIYGAPVFAGLEYYNLNANKMIHVDVFPNGTMINQLISDKDNGIWCLPVNLNFLILYNPAVNKLTKFDLITAQPNSVIKTLNCGKIIDNVLWIGSNNGIHFFDVDQRKLIPDNELPKSLMALKSIEITCIETNKNFIWIGTKTDGLYIFNPKSNQIQHFNKDEINNVSSSFIRTIFSDQNNNVWIGTFDAGIDVSFEHRKNFNFDKVLSKYIEKKFVNSIVSDNKGHLYIGTRNNGLIIYDSYSKNKQNFTKENSFFSCNHVQSMTLDSKGKLWVGTEENIYKMNPDTKKIDLLHLPYDMASDLSYLQYAVGSNSFIETPDKKMLIATGSKGILKFDLDGKYLGRNDKMGTNITQILPYGDEKFIVNSYGQGIHEYSSSSDQFVSLTDKIKIHPRRTHEANTIFIDSDGILWVGNFKYGLSRYDLQNNSLIEYTMKDGLPSNDVIGITEDYNHRLWLSTSYGLSSFDKKNEFINYYLNEGTGNQQFHQRSVFREDNGNIYFGGNNGLTYFNPKSLGNDNKQSPKIVLKSFNIFNQKVFPNDRSGLLKTNLAYTSKIRLNYKYPVFSIDYVGFDYITSNKLKYAYKLEGFNEDWVYEQNRTRASYSNLKPGTYTFKVKAQNNNGIWSDQPAILIIEVIPAPWETIWAIIIYFLVIIFAVFFLFRIILRSKLYKQKLEIEHREHAREKEINDMKIKFFTNISHEIRTPLTLIYGIVEKLSTIPVSELKNTPVLTRLKYNTERLLKMVNQLLMFKNLESDALSLYIDDEDIAILTRMFVEPFIFLAESKDIEFEFIFLVNDLIIPLDRDKYEKILSNLLSNAIKFTNYKGVIKVVIDIKPQADVNREYKEIQPITSKTAINYAEIRIQDNGIGIPANEISEIFNRYKQIQGNLSSGPDYSGSGIGLNFTKRLVELHKGSIKVESVEGKGSTFSFVIPISSEIYENKDWVRERNKPQASAYFENKKDIEDLELENSIKILVVEDDPELNAFIKERLSESYKVVCAFNGAEGLTLAKSQLPDLIVADIMMPLVDGITMCQNVKEDALLSHIPIILLTAKSAIEDQVSGYKHGADAYVVKPFNFKLLHSQIEGLIKIRRKLQKSFRNGLVPNLQKSNLNQIDVNFLQKMDLIIKEQCGDSTFNIEDLAQGMNMSRSSFYRKFVSLTKISPNDYLRKYRINKSIDLMNEGVLNLGEISDLCGFSTQGNYSVAFKKEKEVSPKQFQQSIQKKPTK